MVELYKDKDLLMCYIYNLIGLPVDFKPTEENKDILLQAYLDHQDKVSRLMDDMVILAMVDQMKPIIDQNDRYKYIPSIDKI